MLRKLMFVGSCGLLLAACGESAGDETPVESAVSSEEVVSSEVTESEVVESEETTESGFDGTTLVTEDYTITITEHKVIQAGEGNNFGDAPLLGFWFDVTVDEDVTDREIDPNSAWIFVFNAVQDNDPNAINELNIGILPDEAHLDSQMQTIKPGGTVSSSVSYELTDLETPVELTAAEMFGEEYGSHTYDIAE